MREAVISVSDSAGTSDENEEFFSLVGQAGLADLRFLAWDENERRAVVRIDVEEELDEERLLEFEAALAVERISAGGPRNAYLVEFEADETRCPAEPGDRPSELTDFLEDQPIFRTFEGGEDGLVVDLVGSQETIGETIADFEEMGMDVTLEALRDYEVRERPLDRLTDRQRDVLRTAYEAGFFDVPRDTTVEELAADLELDPSTVSEHLQRAQGNLLAAVFD